MERDSSGQAPATRTSAPARRRRDTLRHERSFHSQSADAQTMARDRFLSCQERQRRTLLAAGLSEAGARAEIARLATGEVWGG